MKYPEAKKIVQAWLKSRPFISLNRIPQQTLENIMAKFVLDIYPTLVINKVVTKKKPKKLLL